MILQLFKYSRQLLFTLKLLRMNLDLIYDGLKSVLFLYYHKLKVKYI